MGKNSDSSLRVNPADIILICIPVFGFTGFFRRKNQSGQNRWLITGVIYLALTITGFIFNIIENQKIYDDYMGFYTAFYLAMILYGFVTLPSYRRAVIDKRGGVSTSETKNVTFTDQEHSATQKDSQDIYDSKISLMENKVHRLSALFSDQPIFQTVSEIEVVATQILSYIVKRPEKRSAAHVFTSYYLPEYFKMLQSYIDLNQPQIKTNDILKAIQQIQDALPTILSSFKNLYESFYNDEISDISNSIRVFQKVMSHDHLADEENNGDSIQLKL
ncbi:MAG: 5-bromo-4-chloroindolyl phosphate hydrolysis protein [Bacillales bacterium]|jgi:5-bromo-4-chloroindolyl phosphate hydrolysis protein|nr:5-bromo-4-chloroindolyl phosphate hydrolysis protein [Bacillales bacterium]